MATPTSMSDHSPKKSPSKDDSGDDQIQIQPEKLEEQDESLLKKIYDNDSEVDKGNDETTKSSTASEQEQEAALVETPTDVTTVVGGDSVVTGEESGRERLKKHRLEMGGRVWIPDTWGQEDLLKDWIDCTTFDSSLVNNTIVSARAALMQQRSTTSPANNPTLLTTIDNSDETSN
ncbi:proline-rich transmembrane protein 2-like [Heracleum sosnowskyi]|uniref:Proline-rich transmembrane protein 2-like n=1 Tax=Heracleum sosnowskyi TaxID=360622 RepID=A0AAD8IR31_9APIA|nr:proline-rich transmembrane protein 2-like [Heracleum sosnowskyi]